MIQIRTEREMTELLETYQTIDDLANQTGFSTRTIYRRTYDIPGVITVKVMIPGYRKRQIRLIPRRFDVRSVLEASKAVRSVAMEFFGIEPGSHDLDNLDPFAMLDDD